MALDAFVSQAKATLSYSVRWTDFTWITSATEVATRAHITNNKLSLIFATHAESAGRLLEKRLPFEQGFADLVKACIVKRRTDRNVSIGPQRVFLRASRYLYDALPLPVRRDPTLITRGHFAVAETACLRREKPSSAYRVSVALEELGKTIDRHGLARSSIQYRSSVKRPAVGDRTSDDFERRASQLPSSTALYGMASLANDERVLSVQRDRLFMRLSELLFVCGFRIGELLSLPDNALVREIKLDTLSTAGNATERIGLRYWPEKGGEPIVKWVPQIANELVLRAINEISVICEPARLNAKWLETHPGDVNIDVKDDERLSLSRVADLIGVSRTDLRTWFSGPGRGGPGAIRGNRKSGIFILGQDLRRALVSVRYDKPMLTRTNGKKQTLGNSLVVAFRYGLAKNRATNHYISVPVSHQQIMQFLAGKECLPSVFERYGICDEGGTPIRLKTHDFRRLLNVFAQRGGLSQVEIARWMGRRRIADNAAYDLRTAAEMAAEMRSLIQNNQVFGTIANQVKALPESERTAYLNERLTMLHTTPHGQCGSNIAENPCETAVSCLGGCRHYLRKKNDPKSRETLLRIESETIVALDRARDAHAQGKINAANWIASHEMTLRTIRAALAIDDDPTLLDGELAKVNPDGPALGEPMK